MVIKNMKHKPKIISDYIKKQKDKNRKIDPLKVEDYIYDAREICKILVQYNSLFSRCKSRD